MSSKQSVGSRVDAIHEDPIASIVYQLLKSGDKPKGYERTCLRLAKYVQDNGVPNTPEALRDVINNFGKPSYSLHLAREIYSALSDAQIGWDLNDSWDHCT